MAAAAEFWGLVVTHVESIEVGRKLEVENDGWS
jgi:hypothetical protein